MPRTNEETSKRKTELIKLLQESSHEIKFTELQFENIDKCVKKICVRDDEEDLTIQEPKFKEEKNIAFCSHPNCVESGFEVQVQYK